MPALRFELTLFLACAACGGAEPDAGASQRPNVLLITLDTVRADYLSCYSDRGLATPNLDALAQSGVRFENCQSASAVTPVSHATILTGRFPYGHGLRVLHAAGGFRLPADVPSLATELGRAGYRTAAVHSAFPVSRTFGFEHGFEHFDDLDGNLSEKSGGTTGWAVDQLQRRAGDTIGRALEWAADVDEPWFLWVHLWDPHDAVLLPPERFLRGLERDAVGNPNLERLYARELQYVDEQIGRLVEGLTGLGQWDATLSVVTADHGEGLLDGAQRHGWYHHRMLYQEQLHVPLIVRPPGGLAGRTVPDLVRTADVAPTIYEWLDLTAPVGVQGRSLGPLLSGAADKPRRAYADQINGYDLNAGLVRRRPDAAFLFSVTEWPWKLIWRPHMPERSELFQLELDPGEQYNRIQTDEAVLHRLLADLAARQPWVLAPFPADESGGSAVGSALEALGYSGSQGPHGDLTWTWRCPRHDDQRGSGSGTCAVCALPLMPVTTWE